MEEKVLKKSKNGLAMVTMFILLYAAAIAAIIVGSIMAEQAETKAGWIVLIVAGGVYAAIGWIFFIGLKVLNHRKHLCLHFFISLFPFSRNLPEAVTFLLDLFRRGALSCALWCIVMWQVPSLTVLG